MDSFKKVFLFLVSTLFFIVLIFMTFSGKTFEDVADTLDFSVQDGIYILTHHENTFQESPSSSLQTSDSSWALFLERFQNFNTILFPSYSKYQKISSNSWMQVALDRGDFFFDIEDVTKTLTLLGSWFTLQPVWGGKFFVSNYSSDGKITLFSMDAVLKISLLDSQTQKEQTEVYLYPHMSFTFLPARNASLYNADRIRISTVQDFNYYAGSLSNGDFPDWVGTISWDVWVSSFLTQILAYEDSLDAKARSTSKLLSSSLPIIEIPWIYYIEEYKAFFLNESKKRVYVRNLAFQTFVKFIQSSRFSSDEYANMLDYFEQLKAINSQDYSQFIESLKPFIYASLLDYNKNKIEIKQKLLQLLANDTQSSFSKTGISSTMLLSSIYRKYDLQNDEQWFYKGIVDFINEYTGDIGVKENLKTGSHVAQKTYALDYLTFFLEKILVPNQEGFPESNFSSLVQILDIYNSLSQIVYSWTDVSLPRTAMYVDLNLIKHLLSLLHFLYFEEKRNSSNLLVRNTTWEVSTETIKLFTKDIDFIYDYYEQNKHFLDVSEWGKDLTIPNDYETIYKEYQEYFAALLDYTKYSVEFDPVKKWLLDINDSSPSDTLLTKDKFITYFSQFSWIDLSQADISVSDDYYDAKNIIINGKNFSFRYFPFNNGQISDIVIDSVEKTSSYKLDLISSAWQDAYNKATWKEKDKVNFKNFFSLTFDSPSQAETWPTPVQNPSTPVVNEDSVVRVFKSTTLLSPTEGLFRNIQSLKFKYNDITVTFSWEQPDISIKNVLFSQVITTWSTPYNLYARFSSAFNANKDASFFSNISFQIYRVYDKDPTQYYYNAAPVKILGSIPLAQVDEKLTQIANMLFRLVMIESTLASHGNIENTDIKYLLPSDRVIIKYPTSQGDCIINIVGDMVESINFSWKNILNNKIKYTEIGNYLP